MPDSYWNDQPTNGTLSTTLTLAPQITIDAAVALTALEQPFSGNNVTASAGSGTVGVTMTTALATIGIT